MQKAESKLTGAQMAILRNRIDGINRKMANTMLRTCRSGILNRARDFSVCVITADSELLSSADSLPIHTLWGPHEMTRYMKQFHPTLRKGDAFLHNSPYHGNSHAADHSILVPVIDDDGHHRLTLVIKAHQADCGNSVPTTLFAAAVDLYEEGALIFPCVKLQSEYAFIDDIIRMIRMRLRVPDQYYGDLLACIGACRIGEREFLALGDELGWNTIERFTEQWFDYSEELMKREIAKMASGKARAVSVHDHFPGTPVEGVPIIADVSIDTEQARIEIDLTSCPDNLPCGLNLTEATTRTAAMIGIFNSIDPIVPPNSGSFRRIHVALREGAVAGIPAFPHSTSMATTNLADRVTNAVQRAVAEITPNSGMGETGAGVTTTSPSMSGIDPRNGKAFVNLMCLGHTAGAGHSYGDAWMTMFHAGNGGLCQIDSVELTELYHPIEIEDRRLLIDTEGAGTNRGAPAISVSYGPIKDCEVEIFFACDGKDNPPLGAKGGGAAAPSHQRTRNVSGEISMLDNVGQITLKHGDVLLGQSQGGGGYGDPHKRDAAIVLEDVREKYISVDRARAVYGVAVNADLTIDAFETGRLRA